MTIPRLSLGLLCATAVAFACSVALARAPATKAAVASERGRQLYVGIGCAQCHGLVGQGGGMAGPRLAAKNRTYEAFLKQLREPVEEMPPYTEKALSDADARAVYDYVATLK